MKRPQAASGSGTRRTTCGGRKYDRACDPAGDVGPHAGRARIGVPILRLQALARHLHPAGLRRASCSAARVPTLWKTHDDLRESRCAGPPTFGLHSPRTGVEGLTARNHAATSGLTESNKAQEANGCPISLCRASLCLPWGPGTSSRRSCTSSRWPTSLSWQLAGLPTRTARFPSQRRHRRSQRSGEPLTGLQVNNERTRNPFPHFTALSPARLSAHSSASLAPSLTLARSSVVCLPAPTTGSGNSSPVSS